MKKIERPDWKKLTQLKRPGQTINMPDGFASVLNIWFDKHIAPLNKLIEGGVEVRLHEHDQAWWTQLDSNGLDNWKDNGEAQTHRALLIGIEPIKKPVIMDDLKVFGLDPTQLKECIDYYMASHGYLPKAINQSEEK